MRFWVAAQKAGLHPVIGAEVTLADHAHLTLLAETQLGYSNLCQLLTMAHGLMDARTNDPWPGKTDPLTTWDDLRTHSEGLIALSGCRRGPVAASLLRDQPDEAARAARHLRDVFGADRFFIELQHHGLPDEDGLARRLVSLATSLNLPCVATDNAHYATREVSRLRDCLIAIHHNETLTEARGKGHLPLNSTYALARPEAMADRFGEVPGALSNTIAIAERCRVSLDFSHRRLPAFGVPAGVPNVRTEFEYLYHLCHAALPRRYSPLMPRVLTQLAHELDVIARNGLAAFFLVMWDIMRFARENGIRCQGRGSAAGSITAYLLGITSIDPILHNLLFERFLSDDGHTMPDIDVDFATDRREEVIQYVYAKYGADHVAMVCNHVTFQTRSALRDLGKVLGFPQPAIDRLAKSIDAHRPQEAADEIEKTAEGETQFRIQNSEFRIPDHPLTQLASLLRQIDGCPRHLGIHSGGMLITGLPLSEVVPLRRATMPGRIVCEWDKDSVEDAGLVKADLLGLRMLSAVSEAVAGIGGQGPGHLDPWLTTPDWLDDPEIYAMLQQADTLGTFQVESRAQQQMLPRLRPARFEDIIIEVAIVRPGPIQGGMVHPYLRRHAGEESPAYLHPCLEPVLRETLGVILFQEQAIRVAVAAAGFTPGEADKLRRAMSRARSSEAMAEMAGRFLEGAVRNGIDLDAAKAIFKQLAGFAGFGFCKSHAASFALIAYQTLWLKRYHPAAFYCGVLNHRPGFYSEEVIVGDARRHGVGLLPIDANLSAWGYSIEDGQLRTGLRALTGLGEAGYQRIESARADDAFQALRDLCERTRLPRAVISDLIRVGACDGLTRSADRRRMLWELGEIVYVPDELPLDVPVSDADLPELSALERMSWEYELIGLSAAGQYMQHYRRALQCAGAVSAAEAKRLPDGRRIRVAGMQVVRQRPETAKGMTFISLEDESGLIDLIVRPDVYERFKPVIKREPILLADGVVQQGKGATSVLVISASAVSSSW
jgi:error-prone DNA polymerase